jgi:hypothetical protein
MVRQYEGPINSLADAFRARRHLWALCLQCGHTSLWDPRTLIGRLDYISLADARKKLRCRRCGRGRPVLVPREEPWSSMR